MIRGDDAGREGKLFYLPLPARGGNCNEDRHLLSFFTNNKLFVFTSGII